MPKHDPIASHFSSTEIKQQINTIKENKTLEFKAHTVSKSNIQAMTSICNQHYGNRRLHGNAALNRMIVLDGRIADLLTAPVIHYLFSQAVYKKVLTRDGVNYSLQDVIYHAFDNGLPAIQYTLNNQLDDNMSPNIAELEYQKLKYKFHNNTLRIVRNIYMVSDQYSEEHVHQLINKLTAFDINDLTKSLPITLHNAHTIIQGCDTDELIQVSGFSAKQIIAQTHQGFELLCKLIDIPIQEQLISDKKKLVVSGIEDLNKLCQRVLTHKCVAFLNPSVNHLLFDRVHIEAALVSKLEIIIKDNTYSLIEFFSILINTFCKNPWQYHHAFAEQLVINFQHVTFDLHRRISGPLLTEKKITKGPRNKLLATYHLEKIINALLTKIKPTFIKHHREILVLLYDENSPQPISVYNLSKMLASGANFQHLSLDSSINDFILKNNKTPPLEYWSSERHKHINKLLRGNSIMLPIAALPDLLLYPAAITQNLNQLRKSKEDHLGKEIRRVKEYTTSQKIATMIRSGNLGLLEYNHAPTSFSYKPDLDEKLFGEKKLYTEKPFAHGVNIAQYCKFPDEEEVLYPPSTHFFLTVNEHGEPMARPVETPIADSLHTDQDYRYTASQLSIESLDKAVILDILMAPTAYQLPQSARDHLCNILSIEDKMMPHNFLISSLLASDYEISMAMINDGIHLNSLNYTERLNLLRDVMVKGSERIVLLAMSLIDIASFKIEDLDRIFKSVIKSDLVTVAKYLLEHCNQGGRINITDSKSEEHLLDLACMFGRARIVELLLSNGFNVSNKELLDKIIQLPWPEPWCEIAISSKQQQSLQQQLVRLLAPLFKNSVNTAGQSALHTAIIEAQYEITCILIDEGFDINQLDHKNLTPLDHAAMINFSGSKTTCKGYEAEAFITLLSKQGARHAKELRSKQSVPAQPKNHPWKFYLTAFSEHKGSEEEKLPVANAPSLGGI